MPGSASEIFLKAGCALVAFIIAYVHLLMVSLAGVAACGDDGASDPWFATMVTGAPALAAVFLMPLGLFMRPGLRWLAVPVFPLAVLAVYAVLPFIEGTTFGGVSPCAVAHPEVAEEPSAAWERVWAPVQLALAAGLVFSASRFWPRGAGRPGP